MKTMKILLTLTLMGMVSFLYGQDAPYTDMVNATGEIDTVTGGAGDVPYYVMPDPVLNSEFTTTYDPAAGAGGNAGIESTWTWDLFESNGTINTQGPGVGADDGPYVEVGWDAPGGGLPTEDTINTQEVSSIGCDGDSTMLPVRIVDPPAFTPWDQAAPIEICETAGAQDVELNTIVDNYVSGGNLQFRFDVVVDSVDPTISTKGDVRNNPDTIVTIPEVCGDGTDDNNVVLLTSYSMPAVDGQITRYQFDFAADGDGGISDHISRKTDYLINDAADDLAFTYTAPTNGTDGTATITYIVYPTPETGDIFFVPNDWNN